MNSDCELVLGQEGSPCWLNWFSPNLIPSNSIGKQTPHDRFKLILWENPLLISRLFGNKRVYFHII